MYVSFGSFEFGDNTLYNISSIDGLDSLPEVTFGLTPKPRRNGSWLGGKITSKRVITIELEVLGDPADDYLTTKPGRALRTAMGLSDIEIPLVFDLGYGETPVMVMASVTAFDMPHVSGYHKRRPATIEFTATDTTLHSTTPRAQQVGPAVRATGYDYGMDYGGDYADSTGVSGTFTASNSGNAKAHVLYEIKGPVSLPAISLVDADGSRVTTFNLNLATSDRLVIDTKANTVLLNGADRFGSASGALVSQLTLKPGNTEVGLLGTSSSPTLAYLNATWRDASN